MNESKTATLEASEIVYPKVNDYLQNLIAYANTLGQTGLDSKQLYSRHARVCNEIEKELGINGND